MRSRVLLVVLALMPLAACGTSVKLPTDRLEKQVSDSLADEVGQTPDDVTCPDALPGKVGATVRCTLTDGTTKLGVTVTTTEVDGNDVHFKIKVDDQ